MKLQKLDEADCRTAIQAGDFSASLSQAADKVAIILTQSWCPQWAWMKAYVTAQPESPDARIFYVEYDLESFFEDFMHFKEGSYGNDQVPYVRYYKAGKLVGESNYVDQGAFFRLLEGSR